MQTLQTLILVGLLLISLILHLHYALSRLKKRQAEEQHHKHHDEKALIENSIYLKLSQNQVYEHFDFIIAQVSAYKLQEVIIQDKNEVPQCILLPYAEYAILKRIYDWYETKELAPLIEERVNNQKNQEKDEN